MVGWYGEMMVWYRRGVFGKMEDYAFGLRLWVEVLLNRWSKLSAFSISTSGVPWDYSFPNGSVESQYVVVPSFLKFFTPTK